MKREASEKGAIHMYVWLICRYAGLICEYVGLFCGYVGTSEKGANHMYVGISVPERGGRPRILMLYDCFPYSFPTCTHAKLNAHMQSM